MSMKGINGFQWEFYMNLIEFLQKNLYQEISENKSLPREKNYPKYLSRHIYYQTFFQTKKIHQQIPKRSLHKQKRSLKRNLYQINFNRNLYHKKLKTQFLYQNHRAKILYQIIPLKKINQTKSLWKRFLSKLFWWRFCLCRFFLVENLSFEIFFGIGVFSEVFW